jgi:hypothetical protein
VRGTNLPILYINVISLLLIITLLDTNLVGAGRKKEVTILMNLNIIIELASRFVVMLSYWASVLVRRLTAWFTNLMFQALYISTYKDSST